VAELVTCQCCREKVAITEATPAGKRAWKCDACARGCPLLGRCQKLAGSSQLAAAPDQA
jgi:hypothetical protein